MSLKARVERLERAAEQEAVANDAFPWHLVVASPAVCAAECERNPELVKRWRPMIEQAKKEAYGPDPLEVEILAVRQQAQARPRCGLVELSTDDRPIAGGDEPG
jgi:hypothetical protein